MAEDTDKASKTEEPSGKRLADARAEGQVPKSPDIAPLLALTGTTSVILIYGGGILQNIMYALLPFIAHPDQIDVSGGGGSTVIMMILRAIAPITPIFAVAAIAAIVGNVGQTGFLWTPKRIQPDLSKLNPLAGFGRIFGAQGLVQSGKSFLKLILVGVTSWLVLAPKIQAIQMMSGLSVVAILPAALDMIRPLVINVLVLMTAIAVLDWFWQRYSFLQNQRMTKQELKQEHKDSDGDPQIKGKRRQLQMARAKQRMMQNVPKATVVVMNPTHYAVALRYVQGEDAAPICVAKGMDAVALRMRALAEENNVPVIEDPPLARGLYASVEIDDVIPREHFEAVARIIGFIFAKGRERARPARARALGL